MNLSAGITIKATDLLHDSVFEDAVIFMKEHNENGAVGVISNRLYGRSLNELEEFRYSRSFPLYDGGPVGSESLFFIHRRPDLVHGSELIAEGIYWGGNFGQAVTAINNKSLTVSEIKIFVGYCGWDAGELEAEIEEGSWIVAGELFAW
jgi:putative transcriptional regulator